MIYVQQRRFGTFSISEYNESFFLVVGEKEYKDTTLRTRRRQCVFTKLRIESVFVSFVSFSFNKPHVSVPTRTCIRVIGEIRVLKKYSCHSSHSCSKKSRVQAPSERPAANKIREIRAIRVRIKRQSKIRVQKYSLNSCDSCSKDLVIKISSQ